MTKQEFVEAMEKAVGKADRPAPFDYHNCAYCNSGQKPCRNGNPYRCEYLHARNQ
jgi:hypothetical protein